MAIGSHFRPTEEEKVEILKLKAGGGDPPGEVWEVDMYGEGKEPWNVFSDTSGWELKDCHPRKKEKYVLTRLSKVGAKNSSRIAGAGSWRGENKLQPVLDEAGNHIGLKKTLTYIYHGTDAPSPSSSHYYLHEYHLLSDSVTDYVLCRVIKDETKTCRINTRKKPQQVQTDKPYTGKKRKCCEEVETNKSKKARTESSAPGFSLPTGGVVMQPESSATDFSLATGGVVQYGSSSDVMQPESLTLEQLLEATQGWEFEDVYNGGMIQQSEIPDILIDLSFLDPTPTAACF